MGGVHAMSVLLDSHSMYWYIEGDPQLSATAETLIQDTANEVLISPASYWEIAIKVSLGKWKLNRTYSLARAAHEPDVHRRPRHSTRESRQSGGFSKEAKGAKLAWSPLV